MSKNEEMLSLNASIKENSVDDIIAELEDREELSCALNACAAQFRVCVGVVCALYCIGIGPCLVGVHDI